MANMNINSKLAEYSTINAGKKAKCKCGKYKKDCDCEIGTGTVTQLDREKKSRIKPAPTEASGIETELDRAARRSRLGRRY